MTFDDSETIISDKRPDARFIVKKGPQAGIIFPINRDRVVLGREEECEVVIRDAEVSRRHIELSWEDGVFILQDLGSTNGSFLNGKSLNTPSPLNSGDTIGLGQTSLQFEADLPGQPNNSQVRTGSSIPAGDKAGSFVQGKKPLFIAVGCGCLILVCTCTIVGIVGFSFFDPSYLEQFSTFLSGWGL